MLPRHNRFPSFVLTIVFSLMLVITCFAEFQPLRIFLLALGAFLLINSATSELQKVGAGFIGLVAGYWLK